MDSKQDTLNQVSSHTILVYPPEILLGGEWFCRFEPDGIATIKGFLEQKGYGLVELVYSSLKPGDGKKKTCFQNSVGWGISSVDQEGLSFRGIIDSALNLSLDSPIALSLKDFLPLTYLSNTRVVGFSIGFPSQLYHSLVLARLIKQLKHDVFVVLGGPLITSYITFVASLHEMGSCVDGIIAGFGEEPLAQLILTLDKKQELKFVPNLRLWTSNGFQLNPVRWTPDRTCLRTVPDYARSTLMREIDPYFPIRPSIGCYWGKCAFCVYPSMSTGTREKRPYVALNPKELVDHIRLLMTKGSGQCFELCADSLPPLYLEEFSKKVIESKLDIRWNAWSCVDKGFSEKGVTQTMKAAGCRSVLLGMESASQRILERINKMQSRRDIDVILTTFSSSGIRLFLTVCIGFPGETYDEAMETVRYLHNLIDRGVVDRTEIRIYRFALMCNTPMLENLREYGISSVDWSDMYYLDDDFTYYYKVSEGMSFEDTKSFVLKWRHRLGISTNDHPSA